ncbi:MAG: MBL fold metallo-hydrolase [Nocardioides sp.]
MDSLTFVGTATTLIRLGGFTLLTDPNFLHRGQRAYLGKGLWSKRLTEPAMQPHELPELDAVVLSHLHGDHFDRVARQDLARTQPVVTTPAAARRLGRWGFDARGLDTWETWTTSRGDETLSVESLPGIHARGLMGALLPPVMGSLIEHQVGGEVSRRVYVSGDTLTGEHVDEIAHRHPDIDVAVVHLGGTKVLLHTVTMDAEQGVDFLGRVRPSQAVPVHHDDYGVFRSPLADFLSGAERAGFGRMLRTVRRGETIDLGTTERRTTAAPRPV